jgi:hypothetical protein
MVSGSVDKVEENLEEMFSICGDTIDSLIDLHMAMLAQGATYEFELHDEAFTLFEGTGAGGSIASIILLLKKQEAVTVFFSRIIDECHRARRDNKSKRYFYLNEVLLGSSNLEHTLENVIKAMGDNESQSIMHNYHCGAIILSLNHFHMSLVGQGVPVDFKGTDEGHML